MEAMHKISYELIQDLVTSEEEAAVQWITWLQDQAKNHNLLWLLAHQDDGVIWGRIEEGGGLIFPGAMGSSPTISLARFEPLYLQKLRLFGPDGELLAWRDMDGSLKARLILEGKGQPVDYIDRTALLWGTVIVDQQNGFTLLREGEQGFYQAPPLQAAGIQRLPAGLAERHYLLSENGTGQAVIRLSRLVGFCNP